MLCPTGGGGAGGPRRRRAAPVRRGATLEERIAGAWARLALGRTAECPLCGGALIPRWSAGAGVVGGRCDSCGSELS